MNIDTFFAPSLYPVVVVDVLPDLLVALFATRYRFSYLHNQSLIRYLDPNVKMTMHPQRSVNRVNASLGSSEIRMDDPRSTGYM